MNLIVRAHGGSRVRKVLAHRSCMLSVVQLVNKEYLTSQYRDRAVVVLTPHLNLLQRLALSGYQQQVEKNETSTGFPQQHRFNY